MHLVDLHVPCTSRQSLELNPDLRSLAATQAKHTAASDLRHSATRAGTNSGCVNEHFCRSTLYVNAAYAVVRGWLAVTFVYYDETPSLLSSGTIISYLE